MTSLRLHALFGLPDPEDGPDPEPSPALLDAAWRLRVTLGSLTPELFVAQSPRERRALFEAGLRLLATQAGQEPRDELARPVPSRVPPAEELAARDRGLDQVLRRLASDPELGGLPRGELLDRVGQLRERQLLIELGRGDVGLEAALARLEPGLRRLLEQERRVASCLERAPAPRRERRRTGA